MPKIDTHDLGMLVVTAASHALNECGSDAIGRIVLDFLHQLPTSDLASLLTAIRWQTKWPKQMLNLEEPIQKELDRRAGKIERIPETTIITGLSP